VRRPIRLTLTALGAGIVLTVVVLSVGAVHVAYRNPELHLVLGAIESMIALLAAYLVFGRFREHRLIPDLLLVASLLVFAATNLLLSSLAHSIRGSESALLAWGPLLLRTSGAALFCAAAFYPARSTRRRWTFGGMTATTLAGMTMLFLVLLPFRETLPRVFEGNDPTAGGQFLAAHPLVTAFQILIAILFGLTAWKITAVASRTDDELLVWVGAGAALAFMARVNYTLFPSLYTDYVYTGDVLRLGWYLMLLVGASNEIRRYWNRLESANDELKELSIIDELTGLRNRRGFAAASSPILKIATRNKEPVTLLFIDLNNMKGINDSFGHDEGDRALKATADLLDNAVRESDVVARLGGDEFCILLAPGSHPEVVLERIRTSLANQERSSTEDWMLSLSIGSASFDHEEETSLQDLITRADAAMYEQKRAAKAAR
jgi:diguanylate cyclase (GGDEF)-like protein